MSDDTRQLGYHFAALPDWVLEHPELDGNAIRVFGLMGRFTKPFLSLAALAETMRCSEDTVRRAIRKLEAAGALVVVPRFDEVGRQTSNFYELAGGESLRGGVQICDPPVADVPATPLAPLLPDVDNELGREKPKQPPSPPARSAPLPAKVTNGKREAALFAQFWAVYPRKVKKPDAFKAFVQALRADADLAEMASGLNTWKAYWAVHTEPKFVPYPGSWLRGQQWNDEPTHTETSEERFTRLFPDAVNGSP